MLNEIASDLVQPWFGGDDMVVALQRLLEPLCNVDVIELAALLQFIKLRGYPLVEVTDEMPSFSPRAS
jgi:hypothetical protein